MYDRRTRGAVRNNHLTSRGDRAVVRGAEAILRARGIEPTSSRVRHVAGLAASFMNEGMGPYRALHLTSTYLGRGRWRWPHR